MGVDEALGDAEVLGLTDRPIEDDELGEVDGVVDGVVDEVVDGVVDGVIDKEILGVAVDEIDGVEDVDEDIDALDEDGVDNIDASERFCIIPAVSDFGLIVCEIEGEERIQYIPVRDLEHLSDVKHCFISPSHCSPSFFFLTQSSLYRDDTHRQ